MYILFKHACMHSEFALTYFKSNHRNAAQIFNRNVFILKGV